MDFIGLEKQTLALKQDFTSGFEQLLTHCSFVNGPEIGELEEKLANLVGVKHCIATSSGTSSLLLSLLALGIGNQDEVIVPNFSFFSTAGVVSLVGATPVFVDITLDTFNLDAQKITQRITPKTKAIIPVNLYGQCADMDEINRIANQHSLHVVEDAAQSLGATYKGKFSGSLTKIGCTSFHPTKPLGAAGDCGACFTDDNEIAQILKELRNHGSKDRYYHVRLGTNARMASIQAMVLLCKLKIFGTELERRRTLAQNYQQRLSKFYKIPQIKEYNQSSFAQYTLMVKGRENLVQYLEKKGVPTSIHYPRTISDQPYYQNLQSDTPNAQKVAKENLCLPIHPYLSDEEQEIVIEALLDYQG